jgi:hypothetical protein
MQLDSTFVAARIIGPVFIAGGVTLIAHNERMVGVIGDFLDTGAVMVLAAFVSLILGLTLVTLHRRWDSVTAILIGVIGWLSAADGAFALIAPGLYREGLILLIANPNLIPIAGCVTALIGVWLSYVGYIAGVFRVEGPRT